MCQFFASLEQFETVLIAMAGQGRVYMGVVISNN